MLLHKPYLNLCKTRTIKQSSANLLTELSSQNTTSSSVLSVLSPMDFQLKQWRNEPLHDSDPEQEQEHHCPPASKLPRLLFHSQQPSPALPLFVSDSEPTTKLTDHLSAYPSHPTSPRMGSYFSMGQWQELQLQALIFRHMLAGSSVPSELLSLVKKTSVLSPPPYYLPSPFHQYPHYHTAMMQSGYWGRSAIDPEPGRCRRTDGKKWRCARDVVTGQKYCERHMHRGRNRSRKPVEIPTPPATSGGNGGGVLTKNNISTFAAAQPLTSLSGGGSGSGSGTHFSLSDPPPSIDLLHLNQRAMESKAGSNGQLVHRKEAHDYEVGESGGQILRCFFDDWPGKLQQSGHTISDDSPVTSSATGLSISMAGNSSSGSDFSLKLSTGNNGDVPGSEEGNERPQMNWSLLWGSNQGGSMGGPLAEALRSSTANSSSTSSSPTSVLKSAI